MKSSNSCNVNGRVAADVTDIASPCVRNCCLNDDDVCLGCGRTITEIIAWHTADVVTKREILRQSRERLQQLRPYFHR